MSQLFPLFVILQQVFGRQRRSQDFGYEIDRDAAVVLDLAAKNDPLAGY